MTTTIAQTGTTTVIVPTLVLGYSATYTTKNVLHATLNSRGRTATVNGAGLRTGRLSLLFANELDAHAAVDTLNQAAVFQFSTTDLTGRDMQFVIAGDLTETLDPETRTAWTVDFDWEEQP